MDTVKNEGEEKNTGLRIRTGESTYVPEQFVDDEGDLLVYDDSGCWIAKNEKGEVIKKVRL